MSDSTNASTTGGSLNELAGQYCVELERLNYGRETIKLYLRSIRRLSQLMVSHGLVLDQLTPEIAAELLLRTEWHGDRRQYAVFAVRRFVAYLVTQGVVKSRRRRPQENLFAPGCRVTMRIIDEACLSILKNCRRSISPGGRILVVEQLIDEIGNSANSSWSR